MGASQRCKYGAGRAHGNAYYARCHANGLCLVQLRNPPDFGRIAWPEDIFGSVEVDRSGSLLDNYQPSGSYRILTNEGM